MFKIKADGTGETKLSGDSACNVVVKDGWIYYGNKSDGESLYRVKADGSQRTKVSADPIDETVVLGDPLLFMKVGKGRYKLNPDGTFSAFEGTL